MDIEYMILLNGLPLEKPYGPIFKDLKSAEKHANYLGITEKAIFVEVLDLDVQVEDEDNLTRGYILEHVSSDGTRHILGFYQQYEELMKAKNRMNGLNLEERKLIITSPSTLETVVQTVTENPSP